MSTSTNASVFGRELYHAIWQLVGTTFFDTSRLTDWSSWEHRFDEVIDGEESALRHIDEMIASLNDRYTERLMAPVVSSESVETVTNEAEQPSDVLSGLTSDNLGYIRITSFDREDITELVEAAVTKIANCDGVVLDLRLNGGGRMHQALECCGFFLNEGLLASIEFRHEDGIKTRRYFINVDQFFAEEELPDGSSSTEVYTRRPPILAGKPLVVIFHSRTASAGELMTVCLVQNGIEGKVHMVGAGTTPGKGIGQAEYEIPGGFGKVRITRCRWLCPGGEWLGDSGQTAANGIEPETLVADDRESPVQAAVKQLRSMLGRV